jgi:hypothetical protein
MVELTPDFHTIRGSDLKRDGMILELIDTALGDEVAEIFYSDASGAMSISVFRSDMPLEVIKQFIRGSR